MFKKIKSASFTDRGLYLSVIDLYLFNDKLPRDIPALLSATNTTVEQIDSAKQNLMPILCRQLESLLQSGSRARIDLYLVEMQADELSTVNVLSGIQKLGLRPATLVEILLVLSKHLHLLQTTPPFACLDGLDSLELSGSVPVLFEDQAKAELHLVDWIANPWSGHYWIFGSRS